jgi:hypothetical protein
MKTIEELFTNTTGGVVYKWRHYLPIYEALFKPFANSAVKILEIGVLRGGSLKLWREYFGSNSQIFGIDIDPASKQYESDGVKIFIGNQGDPEFLSAVIKQTGGFDIVIDDGAHTNFMVMSSLETLYGHTRHLYIVEDTHALYWWWGFYSFFRDIQFAFGAQGGALAKINQLSKIFKLLCLGKYSFIGFIHKIQNKMTTDWHGNFWRKEKSSDVSDFIAATNGISVYDSLVVFEKGKQSQRVAEIR